MGLDAFVLVLEVISVIEKVAFSQGDGVLYDLLAQLHFGSLLHLDDDSGDGDLIVIGEGGESLCEFRQWDSFDDHDAII